MQLDLEREIAANLDAMDSDQRMTFDIILGCMACRAFADCPTAAGFVRSPGALIPVVSEAVARAAQ